jgi:hypothetical protein
MSYQQQEVLRKWARELLDNKILSNENKAERIAIALSFLKRSNAQ